jgi:hypothetical protein
LHQVAYFPFLEDEKVAGVTIAVMFYDQVAVAYIIVAAGCLNAVNEVQQYI